MFNMSGCYFSLVKGEGRSATSELNAFDNALLDAGINDCNLVKISSVIPYGAKYIPWDSKKFRFLKGQMLPVAYNSVAFAPNEFLGAEGEIECVARGMVEIGTVFDDAAQFGVIFENVNRSRYVVNGMTGEKVMKSEIEGMVVEAGKMRGFQKTSIKTLSLEVYQDSEQYVCGFAGCVLFKEEWLNLYGPCSRCSKLMQCVDFDEDKSKCGEFSPKLSVGASRKAEGYGSVSNLGGK